MKCSKCGIEVSSSYLKCPSCGAGFHGVSSASSFDKPQYQTHSGVQSSTNLGFNSNSSINPGVQISAPYASFWSRVGANLIDSFIVVVPALIIGGLIGFLGVVKGDPESEYVFKAQFLGFVLGVLYEAVFLSSSWQATPGKRLLGIKGVDVNFQQITLWRALGRTLGKLLSYFILYIGFIMAAFTKNKQGLHDIMASTYVVRK